MLLLDFGFAARAQPSVSDCDDCKNCIETKRVKVPIRMAFRPNRSAAFQSISYEKKKLLRNVDFNLKEPLPAALNGTTDRASLRLLVDKHCFDGSDGWKESRVFLNTDRVPKIVWLANLREEEKKALKSYVDLGERELVLQFKNRLGEPIRVRFSCEVFLTIETVRHNIDGDGRVTIEAPKVENRTFTIRGEVDFSQATPVQETKKKEEQQDTTPVIAKPKAQDTITTEEKEALATSEKAVEESAPKSTLVDRVFGQAPKMLFIKKTRGEVVNGERVITLRFPDTHGKKPAIIGETPPWFVPEWSKKTQVGLQFSIPTNEQIELEFVLEGYENEKVLVVGSHGLLQGRIALQGEDSIIVNGLDGGDGDYFLMVYSEEGERVDRVRMGSVTDFAIHKEEIGNIRKDGDYNLSIADSGGDENPALKTETIWLEPKRGAAVWFALGSIALLALLIIASRKDWKLKKKPKRKTSADIKKRIIIRPRQQS